MSPFDGLPETIYKYRDWNNDYHKCLLTDNELYFASANQFNDPFDCAIPYRYDEKQLTAENLYIKYLESAKYQHPDYSDSQLQEAAYRSQQRDLIHDEQYQEEEEKESQERFNKKFGIVSLTANENNFLMWSHYSASHTGFCVGFDTNRLCHEAMGTLKAVDYCEEFPTFGLFEDDIKSFMKLTYTKSRVWEYENEYRILKDKMARKTLVLPEDTFAQVILGCKMPQIVKFEVLDLIEKRFPKVAVYDIRKHDTKFKLVVNQIR